MLLTDEQIKPILSDSKINLVLAVPGAGKTTVLKERAERLANIFREKVLIITFSNKAVEDISSKIITKELIKTQTIDSLGFSIIKKNWKLLGEILGKDWPQKPQVITKEEELKNIESLFPNYNSLQLYSVFEDLYKYNLNPSTLLRCFQKGAYFGKLSKTDIEVWVEYEKYRTQYGHIKFQDMVKYACYLLPLPEVSIDINQEFSHILIDEAQDTSEDQWSLLRSLILHAKSTLVVADKNQSIYRWRNANGSILDEIGYMGSAVTFFLTQNFRNSKSVGDFANGVVEDKSYLISSNVKGVPMCIKECKDLSDEVNYVVSKVKSDSAIISRTNSYLESFERELISRNISYKGTSFYRAPHIRAVFEEQQPVAILKQKHLNLPSYTTDQLCDLDKLFFIIEKSSFEIVEERVRKANLLNKTGVTLSTGHGSKGLQWPEVFVVGAQEGHTPHKLSSDMTEERNIFYVMVTREAGKGLHITYHGKKSRFVV